MSGASSANSRDSTRLTAPEFAPYIRARNWRLIAESDTPLCTPQLAMREQEVRNLREQMDKLLARNQLTETNMNAQVGAEVFL